MEKQRNRLAKARLDAVVYELKDTYSDFIYPLSRMEWKEGSKKQEEVLSTDGMTIYYNPEMILREDKKYLKAEILHILFHGLLGHFQIKDDYEEKLCRDIIMDVQASYLLSRVTGVSLVQRFDIRRFDNILNNDFSMEQYYHLTKIKEIIHLEWYEPICKVDDHGAWDEKMGKEHKKRLVLFWKDIQEVMFGEAQDGDEESQSKTVLINKIECILKQGNMYGSHRGENTESFEVGKEGKLNYSELLQELLKVSEVSKEEPDSIAPMFYHYGMELYENIPLIEPLEICERPVLHTIAIAIDVSGSCVDGITMKSFWGETYQCIMQLKDQHAIGEIVLLQCDTQIQKEQRIDLEDFEEIPEKMEIVGRGGTSFVPVFERLKELEQKGTIIDALIYLTDGYGDYPKEIPEYPVYFILWKDIGYENYIPNWINRAYLKNEKGEG